jgi:HEAT repeat protein
MRRWLLLFVVACAPVSPAERLGDEPRDPVGEAAREPVREPTPVASLLRARHPEDLPDRATLDRHGGAEALWAAAGSDPDLVVRARALELLGLYDEPAQVERLLRTAQDPAAASKLRASAVIGLGRTRAGDRAAVVAAVAALVRDDDRRLALEAGAVLRTLPGGEPALAALREDVALCPEVRGTLGP